MARTQIKVETLSNGYSLTINKRKFLYFDEEKLAAGFFYHILNKNTDEVDIDFAVNLMEAAATWPTIEESVAANAKLMADKQNAERSERKVRKQMADLESKYKTMKQNYDTLRIKYARENTREENFKAALKKNRKP